MLIQLLSDLHLETETFDPQPAPGAELLVLAGDIDSTWAAYRQFKGWPVPVLVVAGNHEFDGRELNHARPAFKTLCEGYGLTLLEQQSIILHGQDGRAVRFLGATRWSDFELFGPAQQARCIKVGAYFQRVMRATLEGRVFDADAVRAQGLIARQWLYDELSKRTHSDETWDSTVVITHFAPSLRSGDPRYGAQLSTACFCNADDALIAMVDVWLHGHVHCRHDYTVPSPTPKKPARVVSQARGLAAKGEVDGYDALKLIRV